MNLDAGLELLSEELRPALEKARSSIGHQALLERIGELLAESGELLTPEVAALVVLDELGLAPEAAEVAPVYTKELAPDELEPDLDGIFLEGTLQELRPTRSFARSDGSRGFVTTCEVEGARGRYTVTLWDEHIQPFIGLPRGARVRLEGLYTKERQGSLELHTGRQAVVTIVSGTPRDGLDKGHPS